MSNNSEHEQSDGPTTSFLPELKRLQIERNAREAEWVKKNGPINAELMSRAIEIFQMNGHTCFYSKAMMWYRIEEFPASAIEILESGPGAMLSGYNGYVLFKKKPVIEPGYGGLLTYVPVFGGITYATHDTVGSIYGFDTDHPRWRDEPTRDVNWIKRQIDIMVRGIQLAASLEKEYLQSDEDNERRAQIAQQIVDIEPDAEFNFGTNVNILFGKL